MRWRRKQPTIVQGQALSGLHEAVGALPDAAEWWNGVEGKCWCGCRNGMATTGTRGTNTIKIYLGPLGATSRSDSIMGGRSDIVGLFFVQLGRLYVLVVCAAAGDRVIPKGPWKSNQDFYEAEPTCQGTDRRLESACLSLGQFWL